MLDLSGYKVIINVGTGGIGKTTLSAALGHLASEKKIKTLVLTIDPSQRLKSVMGLDAQDTLKSISEYLDVGIINHQQVFNDFILDSVPDAMSAEKLIKNSLYQQLSTGLARSQEFTSLECVYKHYKNKKYDLIVLDTAPNEHVIDFLNAPQKLATLFNPKIFDWFSQDISKQGFFKKVLNKGTVQVFDSLSKITGSEFMNELYLFFSLLGRWQRIIHERTAQYHDFFTSDDVAFLQVLTLEPEKMRQTFHFAKEVKKMGYNLVGSLINRAAPAWSMTNLRSEKWSPEVKKIHSDYTFYFESLKSNLDSLKLDKLVLLPEQRNFISEFDHIKIFSYHLSQQVKL